MSYNEPKGKRRIIMETDLVEVVVDSGAKVKLYVGVGLIVAGVVLGTYIVVVSTSYLRYKSKQERLAILAKYEATAP